MIRLLESKDIDSIIKIENDTLFESLGFDMLNDIISNPIMKAFVYENNDKVLGYISISFDGIVLEILNFCVDKFNQGLGIGKRLLNYAIMDSYKNNCKSVILEVRESNINAIKLYESFGFKRIHIRKNYYKNLENALVYEKKLYDFNEVLDIELNHNAKKIITDDYIKYYDEYQFDKYYHNYYSIKNEDILNELIELNKDKPFFCFEYDKLIKNNESYELDINILMASFIKAININTKIPNNVYKVDESNKDIAFELLFNDSIEYGDSFARRDSLVLINNCINQITNGFLIIENGKALGFINVHHKNDIIELDHFFILEEYRNMGYGSKLVKYVLNYFSNLGSNIVILIADEMDTPKDMYKKWGFIEIEKTYFYRRGN